MPQPLLADLQRLLRTLEADLLQRADSNDLPEIGRALQADYEQTREAARTAQSYEEWRGDYLTQMAAAWVLSCAFVRFLEDNRLIEPPKLSGPGERLARARDEHELFFRSHPKLNDRDYLLEVLKQLAAMPGGKEIFGLHNPINELPNWLSGDAAGEMLTFFQRIDPDTGILFHDFTDPAWDTRFLGDLYQDLSEAARKKYALLQTPEFIEEFILDRALEPAIEEFGLEDGLPRPSGLSRDGLGRPSSFRMIDPACGSGHFLLGAFRRLLDRWQRREPGTNTRVLVQRALDSVHGVDVNPYAVAIARFRLLLVAMRESGISRLADAPAFAIHVVCGDSLLHGAGEQQSFGWRDVDHATYAEDLPELRRVLVPGRYHAVVANPPYITPKDRALNQAYRERYAACHMKYSLSVPFMERIFRLATEGGFTGQITANSFMKREFGKKLIEQLLPTIDLTHVIDTSGAYIPGHGTPTVILFGRHRQPLVSTIRTVMGIRGEPSTPDDPAKGLVWSAIVEQVDRAGSQSEFVSVADTPRESFAKHPWSIGGGGAAELKERLDAEAISSLSHHVDCIGFGAILGEDEAFGDPVGSQRLRLLPPAYRRPVIEGDQARDWSLTFRTEVLFPYDKQINLCDEAIVSRFLWTLRTVLWERNDFSKMTYRECGRSYWEYHQIPVGRNRTPLSIVYGEVATHNHFVLDRGGKVFKQTAPVIKLPAEATEEDHLALLGLLNSSTACFWLKQVCHNKGSTVDQHGARQRTDPFEDFFAFNATKLAQFPLPGERPLAHARLLDELAQRRGESLPASVLRRGVPTREAWHLARRGHQTLSEHIIAAQEELDWACYRLYGLIDEELVYPTALTPALCGPHPPCADGEQDGELVGPRHTAVEDPIQLAWMVNEISAPPESNQSPSPSAQGGWGRNIQAASALANHLLHHPGKLDGADETEPSENEAHKGPVIDASDHAAIPNPIPARRDKIQNLALGRRAFEIVLARKMAAGELQTTWFARHGSTPITELPEHWPEDYRRLVERRIELIETNPQIALIEQPEYKRRWNTMPWKEQAAEALRDWLLDRLESYFDFDGRMAAAEMQNAKRKMQNAKWEFGDDAGPQRPNPQFPTPNPLTDIAVVSIGRLADVARQDAGFMQVAELYRDDPAFDVTALVAELAASESVPLLPVLRYKASGLRKRAEWERVWELQREEDVGRGTTKHTKHTKKERGGDDADSSTDSSDSSLDPSSSCDSSLDSSFRVFRVFRGSIPVPPKYTSADFSKSDYWRLRGKLDVPKERWVSFPHCEGPDGTLVVAWAGYDYLQLGRAISGYYIEVQERLGGRDDPRLVPLLAGLIELLAWLKQWHNEPDATFNGMRMGDYFEGFVQEEARQMGKTLEEVKAWQPPVQRPRRAARAKRR